MVPQHITNARINDAAYTIIDTPGKADRESLECAKQVKKALNDAKKMRGSGWEGDLDEMRSD